MNTILEDVFLHDTVFGGKSLGFITRGAGAPAQAVGHIVRHEELRAVYVAYACHPTAFLTPSHLRTIAKRLNHINENDSSH